jgi:multidrug efflux pump
VSVAIAYPGAAAEVVERDVTRVVEDNLSGIDAVELIDSTSRAGFAQITVEFALSRDLEAAAADVRDRVSAVRGELPDEAEEPVIRKSGAGTQAMMWLTLTSDARDRRGLTEIAERVLSDPLSIQPGVSQVIVGGARRYAMRVRLDRDRMAARGVTVADVATALRRENVERPAGRIETPSREFTVRADARPEDLATLSLRESADGGQVRLGDVAVVELGAEDDRSAVLRSGIPAVGLGVVRQSGANALSVAEAVRAELERLAPLIPPDVEVAISYDQSLFISASIRSVLWTLAITVALVIGVVWLSLGSVRATLAPAVTIPVSAVGAFALMYALGFSVNTLTLLALVLAIGLVVDDAIVVVENVDRRRREGEPALAAGVRGAEEVTAPVLATTAVLLAVLLPIAAMSGFVGQLFTEFALSLAAAVALSSFLALTVAPALAARAGGGDNALSRGVARGLEWSEKRFSRLSDGLIARPWLALLGALVLGASVWLFVTALPGELAPTEDRGVIIIPVETPPGATLSETEAAVERIRAITEPYRGEDGPVEDTIEIVGTSRAGPSQVGSALIIVKLKPWDEREMGQQALVDEIVGPIAGLPGAQAVAINPASLTPDSFGKPVQMVIAAPDYDSAFAWARQMRDWAREQGDLQAIELGFDRESPQLRLMLDRGATARLGLEAARIGEAMRIFFGGTDITEIHRDGETYEVIVRGRAEDRDAPEDIGALQLRNENGVLTPLGAAASVETIGAPASFRRVDRRPSVVLSAVPAPGTDLAAALGRLEGHAEEALPAEAQIDWLGLSRDFQVSQGGAGAVFGLALLVAFLVLAALFGSFIQPFAILLAAPLAVATALAMLWLTGQSLNLFSQIGLLLVVGLVAKNAILVVDFANARRREGMDLDEAVKLAARTRFRPVIMTSVATFFGAVPLALATGPGEASRSVLGLSIMGGIIGATAVTLLLTPGLYRLVAGRAATPGKTEAAVDAALRESEG